jgi:EAL domain-containing protein (putative c-di-GMP-specific phosphodiesterase class I)/GGDEF domain-containing protein
MLDPGCLAADPEQVAVYEGQVWQGWTDELAGLERAVVSGPGERARAGGPFPRIRSWLALGAPVELLSPLSVLRVLVPLLALALPLVAVGAGGPAIGRDAAWVAVGVLGGTWVVLVIVRYLERVPTTVVTWVLVGVLAGAMAGERGSGLVGDLVLVVPLVGFVAVFLGGRLATMQGSLLVGWALVLVAVREPRAVPLVVAVGIAPVLAGLTGGLLARALARVGTVDAETGLRNAVGSAQVLQRWGVHEQRALNLVVVDVLGLTEAREALGHRVAVELLRRAVEEIGTVVPHGALVGRLGNDQLLVAWPRAEPEGADAGEGAAAHAARFVAAVDAGRFSAGDLPVTLRASAGVARAPEEGRSVSELLRVAARRADGAYRAGEPVLAEDPPATRDPTGRASQPLAPEDLVLLAHLEQAIHRGELWVALQPQVAARSGELVGVEALARWWSPVHGEVSPGRFVPLAERTGLVDALTLWVLGAALDSAQRLWARGVRVPVSVNVSARSLAIPDLPSRVLGELDARGLSAAALTVEITETAAADLGRAATVLAPLHDAGVGISIDDFGSGYTSLAALPQLPVDEVKVDLGFVRRMRTSRADRAVVATVQTLAARLGLRSVAEGVEDADLARQLADMGYEVLQGFGVGRPMAEAELFGFLQERSDLWWPVGSKRAGVS